MKTLVTSIAALCLAQGALAGSATGKITTITVADHAIAVLFALAAPIEGTPRCNESQRFSLNLKKPGGRAAYMALLEAKQHGYTVRVEGLNTCANEWKSEDSKSITLM